MPARYAYRPRRRAGSGSGAQAVARAASTTPDHREGRPLRGASGSPPGWSTAVCCFQTHW